MEQKKALITGITGQDGSYLAEFLLSKGYKVYGIIRRSSSFNTGRIDHIFRDVHDSENNLHLIHSDLHDNSSINRLIRTVKPDEIYNLAAQSHVRVSFDIPEYTNDVNALGTLRLLEAIRDTGIKTKFYQASSSEMFGKVAETPQRETTPFHPRSPYGVSKVFGHLIARNYRESYNMFICCGILFNHESPRRGETFVTRKITRGAVNIKLGKQDKLFLGNLDARRDWGYAKEYCVDLGTEALTETGFKSYDQIKRGDRVINFNLKKNRLEKDSVLKTHLLDFSNTMIKFEGRGLTIQCTPEHRMIFQSKSKTSKGGWSGWKICSAKELYGILEDKKIRTKYDYRLPSLNGYDGKDLDIADEWLSLIGYLAAEGNIKFTSGNGRGVVVSLSQSNSINPKYYKEIKGACDKLKLRYNERLMQGGTSEFIFNADSTRRILDHYDGYNIHRIPEWVLNGSSRQLEIVLEAMMNGDGSWSSMTYVSKNLALISDFQTIATKVGYRTTVHKRKSGIFECVLIAKRKKHAYITSVKKISYSGKVWCITTKNGSMVIRKNNNVSVIGNCEAMWMMMQHDEPDDYVIATGETHSVKEFVDETFDLLELDPEKYIGIDPRYFRPAEVDILCGDATKARNILGWKPKVKFKELVRMMVESDLNKMKDK